MGIALKWKDTDSVFHRQEQEHLQQMVINDTDNHTEADMLATNKSILTTNEGSFDDVPKCQCGSRKGRYNVGMVCHVCGTTVEEPICANLKHLVWIRRPNGVERLLKPHFVLMFKMATSISSGKFDIFSYLTDSSYRYSINNTDKIKLFFSYLDEANLHKRGYNHFVQNFDKYMEIIFTTKLFKKRISDPPHDLYLMLQDKENREGIFTDYIPLPNKALLVIENTQYGVYVDKYITKVIEPIRHMTGIDVERNNFSLLQKERKTAKCLSELADYYKDFYTETLSPKSGWCRKQIYGTKSNFTFRTVISSLTNLHRYDEIHIPWGVGVNLFYNHIVSKLFRRGWLPNEVFSFLAKYSLTYHPVLEEVFNELISEAGERGIPVLYNRNPTEGRGSIQRLFITKVKTVTDDITTSMSILIVAPFNADFDGDALNGLLLLDHELAEIASAFGTEINLFDLRNLYKPFACAELPQTIASMLTAWSEEQVVDESILSRMREMAIGES